VFVNNIFNYFIFILPLFYRRFLRQAVKKNKNIFRFHNEIPCGKPQDILTFDEAQPAFAKASAGSPRNLSRQQASGINCEVE
jgi:hypothetical protein